MIQLNLEPGTSTLQVTGIKTGTKLFSIHMSEVFNVTNITFITTLLQLLDTEVQGAMFLQTFGNYLPVIFITSQKT